MKFLVGPKYGQFGKDELDTFLENRDGHGAKNFVKRKPMMPPESEPEVRIPWERVGGPPSPAQPRKATGALGGGRKPPMRPPPKASVSLGEPSFEKEGPPVLGMGGRSDLYGNTLDGLGPGMRDEVDMALERQQMADTAAVRQYADTEQNARDDKFMGATALSMAAGMLDGGIGLGAVAGGLGAYGGAQYQTQDPLEQAAYTAGGAALGAAGSWAAPRVIGAVGRAIRPQMGPQPGAAGPGAVSPGYFGQAGQAADDAARVPMMPPSSLADDFTSARVGQASSAAETMPLAEPLPQPPSVQPVPQSPMSTVSPRPMMDPRLQNQPVMNPPRATGGVADIPPAGGPNTANMRPPGGVRISPQAQPPSDNWIENVLNARGHDTRLMPVSPAPMSAPSPTVSPSGPRPMMPPRIQANDSGMQRMVGIQDELGIGPTRITNDTFLAAPAGAAGPVAAQGGMGGGARALVGGAGLLGGAAGGVVLVQGQDGQVYEVPAALAAEQGVQPYAVPRPTASPLESDMLEPDASYPVGPGSVGGVPMSEFGAMAPMMPPESGGYTVFRGNADYGESNPPKTPESWAFASSRGSLDAASAPHGASWRLSGDPSVTSLPYPGMPGDIDTRRERAAYDRWADQRRAASQPVNMTFDEWRSRRT